MKLTEIITESQLQEGPLLNKLGTAVGKGVGAVAKGAGAVAGGIAGIGSAFKKGYAAGKGTVAGAGDDNSNTAAQPGGSAGDSTASTANTGTASATPSKSAAPQAKSTTPAATPQAKTPTPAATPQAKPAAQDQTAAAARTKTAATDTAANDTQYAQAQKAIAALQPVDQKKILTALQSDAKVKASLNKPAAKSAPVAPPAAPATDSSPAVAPPTPAATEPAIKKSKGRKKPAGPSQAEIDADRARIMGPTSDSIIRKGQSIVEHIDEAGLMAKLGTKVGQAAQAVGKTAGTAVKAVQDIKADPEHAKNLVKAFNTGQVDQQQAAAAKIQDASGTVPKEIIGKLNQLSLEQRDELYQLLVKKTV